MNKTVSGILRIAAVVLVIALAWTLRDRAVDMLSIDYDEDDYLRAGQEFANLIRTSDWRGFGETNYRPEHPPLAKIVVGLSILSAPEKPLTPDAATTAAPNQSLPRDLVQPARTVNAVFGVLTVALLALVNPLGGLFLALHTFTIKYVSQIMLEALPALTSLITVLAYIQSKKGKSRAGWLVVSAIFLGLTAASKYLYCVVALAILIDWLLDAKRNTDLGRYYRSAALWGLLALIVFFLFDPYLWPDPGGRLQESVFYHAGYSTGASEVQSANFPPWQPFVWLTMSPMVWHPGVFPIAPDFFIVVLAALGVARLWRKERVYALWLGMAILFLLLWPTKWPQYVVILTVPLSLAAAEGAAILWEEIVSWWKSRKDRSVVYNRSDKRRSLPWLVPGLLAFAVLTLFPLIFQFALAMVDLYDGTLRDGLQGGIWREVWLGLTGQVEATLETPQDGKVHYTGWLFFPDVFYTVSSFGVTFFTIMWAVLSVSFQTVLGIIAALLLWQRGIKFRRGWQLLFILPWAIPEAIGAMLWLNIFQPLSGLLTLAIKNMGHFHFIF